MSHHLAQFLKDQKVTAERISELTGVSTLALEYMLQPDALLPKTHVAQKVAKVLDVPVHAIWPELGNKKE